ncbi:MAG: flagellar export protein FliJ [Planctomycetaceae bacterium]|jgi:flagellar export protein FliJ|nr:flagellar export protein FliJ [Planctomycetaceae bacterium]
MFKFRLTPLLKIRENLRREKQAELAKALEAETVVVEKLTEIEQNMLHVKEEARTRILRGKISVDFMVGLRRHEAFLLAQQRQIREQLEILRTEIEKRREAVREADKEVRVMEKLHEKQKDRYDFEERNKETLFMDEIAIQKTARQVSVR